MITEPEARKALEKVGLVKIAKSAPFSIESAPGPHTISSDNEAPVFSIESFSDIGIHSLYDFQLGCQSHTAKYSLRIGTCYVEIDGLNGPFNKSKRKSDIFEAFGLAHFYNDEGIPIVLPIALLHATNQDEYVMIEPNGTNARNFFKGNQEDRDDDKLCEIAREIGYLLGTIQRTDNLFLPAYGDLGVRCDFPALTGMVHFDSEGITRVTNRPNIHFHYKDGDHEKVNELVLRQFKDGLYYDAGLQERASQSFSAGLEATLTQPALQ